MTCNDCLHCAICINGGFARYQEGSAEECRDFLFNKRFADMFLSPGRLIYVLTPKGNIIEEQIVNCERQFQGNAYHTTFYTDNGTYTESDIGKTVLYHRLDAWIASKLIKENQN